MIPMKYYGIIIHDATPAEAIGYFVSAGVLLAGLAFAVFLAVRSGRRDRP